MTLADAPPEPVPPAGIRVRTFESGRDDRDVHRLIDDAFGEWPGHDHVPFEDWAQFVTARKTFAPGLSPLAFDGDRVVGAVLSLDYEDEHEGYVHQVAVHREYRHQGIARALLQHAFAGYHQMGRQACTLSTNSYTGALSLYERVGMRIRRSYTRYEKALRPGPCAV
jgi:ribosomal protein S18 acetylase RimI-like enzyme